MGAIVVSIAVQKGVSAILIMREGRVIRRRIERVVVTDGRTSIYHNLIRVFSSSLRLLRNYLESDSTCRDVIFELYNATFLKWIDVGFAKGEYQEDFAVSMELLHSLPIRYTFMHKEPIAKKYTDMRYVEKKLPVGDLDLSVTDGDESVGTVCSASEGEVIYEAGEDFVEYREGEGSISMVSGVAEVVEGDDEDWGSAFTDDWVEGQGSSDEEVGIDVEGLADLYGVIGDGAVDEGDRDLDVEHSSSDTESLLGALAMLDGMKGDLE